MSGSFKMSREMSALKGISVNNSISVNDLDEEQLIEMTKQLHGGDGSGNASGEPSESATKKDRNSLIIPLGDIKLA